jgi:hypothetical protein
MTHRFPMAALAAALLLLTGCADRTPPMSDEEIARNNEGVALMGQYLNEEARQRFADLAGARPDWYEVRVNEAIATLNRQTEGDELRALEMVQAVLVEDPDQRSGGLRCRPDAFLPGRCGLGAGPVREGSRRPARRRPRGVFHGPGAGAGGTERGRPGALPRGHGDRPLSSKRLLRCGADPAPARRCRRRSRHAGRLPALCQQPARPPRRVPLHPHGPLGRSPGREPSRRGASRGGARRRPVCRCRGCRPGRRGWAVRPA